MTPLFRRPSRACSTLCGVTGGLRHRLLWVLSRSDVSAWFVYYWLIISVPPSLRGGERRGLGQRPEALDKSWFVLSLRTSPLQAAGIDGFSYSAVCYPRKGAKYLLASIPSRNVTIRVRKRNEQLNLIIGVFSPQPVARACAVPKLSSL